MNVAEALAREIARVSTKRQRWRTMRDEMSADMKIGMTLPLAMMDVELEIACAAAGTNDVLTQTRALKALQDFDDE